MIGGIYFAAAPFAGLVQVVSAGINLAATATITLTASATISAPPPRLAAEAAIVWTATADLTAPITTTVGISIGGVPVTGRVRLAGITIRDILNDAPNTCTFTIEGDGPAVGQAVRVTSGPRLLFTGSVQTIDQAFESKPEHLAWYVTAIDDTAAANARRPFGTWFETSATTIAQSLTSTFAPGFSPAGIEAGLPAVTIVFDGAEPFIACLARLATAVGGYCKIEDATIYLFQEDTSDPPAPISDDHRFLMNPPVTVNTDASQLRTRVYGKGYGETIPTDVTAGETLLPIQDGALFPPLGGTAIVGLTPEGAQSDKITFTGVVGKSGGSLVGTGSSPTNPPVVALAGGTGVTSGDHTLSVAYRTAAGQSLAGPPAAITAGTFAPPATAPTAGTPTNGTGPDQGSHEYAASFVTAYGETVAGAISNAVTTSAASGQIPAPGTLTIDPSHVQGTGLEDGAYTYKVTLVNATGETTPGPTSGGATVAGQLIGQTSPVPPLGYTGTTPATTGGNLTPGIYAYWVTYTTASGESLPTNDAVSCQVVAPNNACSVPLVNSPDGRVTGKKIYRSRDAEQRHQAKLCGTVSNNTQTAFFDTSADAAIVNNPNPPTVDTTANPGTMTPFNRLNLINIPIGPAGTTDRRIYRAFNASGHWNLVTTIGNNTATTYLDTKSNTSLGAEAPTSNSTGTAVQRVPVTNIPIGPAGVTSRNLYRRFNGAGAFRLVTTLANNTLTTFTDAVANASLGAASLGTATAVGNQLAVTLPIGAAAVTTRELYMSPVGGARRLIQTIADNVTTAVTVTIADAAITGALEPGADSSGLQQPHGQVNPGATVIPVASSAPFRPAGGWVVLGGGQVVKHTGISGNTLTGVPASGSGAITTAVIYGQQALPSPMLVGVAGLARPMLKGSAVHIWIQRDDLPAQAEHAARTGGDGIVEFLIVDGRRAVDSLTARCDADLALFSRPIVTVGYATRDLKTKSGKPIVIDLPSQRIAMTLTIQEVTITEIDLVAGLAPRFTVKASNVRFSLEDTLRRLIGAGPVVGGST